MAQEGQPKVPRVWSGRQTRVDGAVGRHGRACSRGTCGHGFITHPRIRSRRSGSAFQPRPLSRRLGDGDRLAMIIDSSTLPPRSPQALFRPDARTADKPTRTSSCPSPRSRTPKESLGICQAHGQASNHPVLTRLGVRRRRLTGAADSLSVARLAHNDDMARAYERLCHVASIRCPA